LTNFYLYFGKEGVLILGKYTYSVIRLLGSIVIGGVNINSCVIR
jgi:hypothetical protein